MVWLDDFRSVIGGCLAVVVSAAPMLGNRVTLEVLDDNDRQEFMQSPDYTEAQTCLPFCRLWCIVEMYAAVIHCKPVVFH